LHYSHPAALLIRSASKAARDPERPKRPTTAYFRFAADYREKHSETKQGAKQIGEAWSQLSEAQKQPFILLSTNEREAYKKVFEEYKASGKFDAFKRDPALPKRPLTPFFTWAETERNAAQLTGLKVAEAAKILGASWAALAQDKKAPILATYKADLEVYATKMKAYKDSGSHQEWLKRTGRFEAVEAKVAQKQAEKDKVLGAKAKEKAKLAKAKEAEQASKEKAKAKALATAEKVKDGLRKEKLKATAAKAAEKAKNEKAKEAAKASQAKKQAKDAELKAKDKEKALAAKAKEAAAKKKSADKEKAAKAAAKAKERLVVAKAAKGGSAKATARA